MFDILLTGYTWLVTVGAFLVTGPICFLSYPFVTQKRFSRLYEKIPASIIFFAMRPFWKLQVIDNRRDKSWGGQYVVVANHLSFVDSLAIAQSIPLEKKFMIGEIFTWIPLFGTLSKWSGHVTADLNNPSLNRTAVPRAVETIKRDNCSFAIFPEGKRELTPYQLEKFKTGAYRIAEATGLKILPVTISGTYEAMRFWGIASTATITIWIDEPFQVNGDYEECINQTKNIIEGHLSKKS